MTYNPNVGYAFSRRTREADIAERRRQRPTWTLATAVDELGTGGNLSPAQRAPDRRAYRVIAGPAKEGPRLSALLVNRTIFKTTPI
jgi:hypothetical protein